MSSIARRLALVCFPVLAVVACGPMGGTGDGEAFCANLAAENEGCWNEELSAECLEVYEQCGERIAVAESCPVQLGCS